MENVNKQEMKCLDTVAVLNLIREGHSIEEISQKNAMPSLKDCLLEMLGRQNKSNSVVAGLAGINPATLHKIMEKKMVPSRNVLLRLALTLEMSFDETQVLLKSGNCASLSGRRERDLYIIDGIEKKLPIDEINDTLKSHNLLDLNSKG